MIAKTIFALGLIIGISATPTFAQHRIENGYWSHGFTWDRNGGGTTLVYTFINHNGKIAVCGSYYTDGPNSVRRLSTKSLKDERLAAGNVFVIQNLRFLKEVRSEEALGQDINCKATNVDWFEGANDDIVSRVSVTEY